MSREANYGTGGALKRRSGTVSMFRLPNLRKNKENLPPKFGTDLRSLGPLHACPCGSKVGICQIDHIKILNVALIQDIKNIID